MNTVIEVKNLSKQFRVPTRSHGTLRGSLLHPFQRTSYEEFQALQNISFSIDRGEFFGIIGHNGSGKSTLLKLIAGIYKPDSGSVEVTGRIAPFIELGVGFNPELSGRDNVFINGALLGLSQARLRERYDSIVEFAELERFMDLKLRNFSSGMQVRLAFSIALEAGSDILLTDEVLAVGDARFQQKCFDVFRKRKAAGGTVVFVSHDLGAMTDFCDRVLLLEKGKPIMLDEPRLVVHRYQTSDVANLPKPARTSSADAETKNTRVVAGRVASGDGDATSDRALVKNGETLHVEIDVEFGEDQTDAIVGMTVKDRIGKIIAMGNTLWFDTPTGARRAGDRITVRYSLPNVLAEGLYRISGGVSEASIDGSLPGRRLDLKPELLEFRVESDRATQAAIDVPIVIDVSPSINGSIDRTPQSEPEPSST